MNFEELNINKPLSNALQDMGFLNPTPIQQKAFPIIMSGKDVIAISQTGTGKTLAYLLPLLRQHKFSEERHPKILIIVPTRELVIQTIQEIEKLTTYITIRFAGVYGGTNIKTQKQLVYNGLDILVATPGRLYDLALSGALRLKQVKKLVIDEIDEMLDLGFLPQLTRIFDLLPKKRQNLMFSATLTENVENIIHEHFSLPEKIEIASSGTPLEQIIQYVYQVPNFYTKRNLLGHILQEKEEFSKVLVFLNNKKLSDKLEEYFSTIFPDEISIIHSNKSQNYRINAIKNFESGLHRVLIATDIAARGLDIRDVSHVINFDFPDSPENYIHRIGRTGRADKTGTAISFVNDAEKPYQETVEKLMNKSIDLLEIPEEVEISDIYTDEEKPNLADKHYLKLISLKNSKGAFHEKKEKNKKVNSGSPALKRKKYKKPQKRSGKK